MYLDFYGLTKRPFDMTPDPSFFFPSQKHTEALASLTYAVTEKRGFVVITGEIGSGKTTVCRTLLQKLDPAAKVAMLTNTTLTAKQLLEYICRQFGIATERQSKVSLLGRLNHFLLEQNEAGSTAVLIMDEAQDLSVKALEETRLISNIETDTQKLIQIMLLGQPELRDKLNRPDLEQLRQRISLRYHLRSLDKDETRGYIEHRLKIAGDDGRVKFTKGALDRLYRYSGGTPRLINVVCDQALLMGYLRETRKIDESIIREIVAEFSPQTEERRKDQQASSEERRPRGFLRFFRRKGESESDRRHAMPSPPPPPLETEQTCEQTDAAASPQVEERVLRRLSELKLANIWADNGHFVAMIDGVQIQPGDRIFEMTVAQIDRDRILFASGDKHYEMSIQSSQRDEADGSSPSPADKSVNVEGDPLTG